MGSLLRELVLVEHALVEPGREADVVDVALVEVDAAAQLAARDVVGLAQQPLEEMRRLDRDRATAAGHVEVGADVAAKRWQAEAATGGRNERAPELRQRLAQGRVRRPSD